MRGPLRVSLAIVWITIGALNSGCALSQMKNANQRLKDANDQLIAKYNRLEADFVAIEKELRDRNLEVAELRDRLDRPEDTTTALVAASESTLGTDEFRRLGLESETTARGTVVRLDHAVFFALGKASLSSDGQRILSRVSSVLNSRYPNKVIRVEGHTDDVPVRKSRNLYPTNWELSTARACTVVRYLVDRGGISPHRIYPAGFSYFRPRANGSSSSARDKNRRVEILIVDDPA